MPEESARCLPQVPQAVQDQLSHQEQLLEAQAQAPQQSRGKQVGARVARDARGAPIWRRCTSLFCWTSRKKKLVGVVRKPRR